MCRFIEPAASKHLAQVNDLLAGKTRLTTLQYIVFNLVPEKDPNMLLVAARRRNALRHQNEYTRSKHQSWRKTKVVSMTIQLKVVFEGWIDIAYSVRAREPFRLFRIERKTWNSDELTLGVLADWLTNHNGVMQSEHIVSAETPAEQ
ncbi:hypothetical protein BAUCODRAFT_253934 [Baudoinia panamericana UAMH 10762]|uniref:Uncharacterized protein n=1 Tax=Baudoinia panamericana (strain UAMH 10762) TaxID=717646 RepID=M2LEX7_BAUPA|nr:uncharacterized protein BAUCODRAFT_253934 [Baudoinia panamericana UAMH 10762]EMC92567.1 hypothetical protein BAUCODRAFT_253934 [Baudoinia panamericana UAMH 10762]